MFAHERDMLKLQEISAYNIGNNPDQEVDDRPSPQWKK